MAESTPLLELRSVSRVFEAKRDFAERLVARLRKESRSEVVHAVDNVSFSVARGEVVGLVGESGCGKSTLGRLAAGLMTPSSGEILWQGQPVAGLDDAARRRLQLRMQMVFQDPFAALNPRMRVVDIVGEAPVAHGLVPKSGKAEYVREQLVRVGLDPDILNRFPHQFSGGQRARIGIARALAVQPEFLICDESIAALDVSIQAQILNLFQDLRTELNLTYLFISHDLGVVRHISDRILIMYLGRIVEMGPAETVFTQANHPYSQALLAGIGSLEPRKRDYVPVEGEIPSPLNPPSGCHFYPRCPHAMPICRIKAPALVPIAPGHASACYLNDLPN